jgi:hypothetical protein
MKKVETVLSVDIPNLMRDMRNPVVNSSREEDAVNPFSLDPMTTNATTWAVTAAQKTEADNRFQGMSGNIYIIYLNSCFVRILGCVFTYMNTKVMYVSCLFLKGSMAID